MVKTLFYLLLKLNIPEVIEYFQDFEAPDHADYS